jgi:diacylglycerol O-acyltransferase 1
MDSATTTSVEISKTASSLRRKETEAGPEISKAPVTTTSPSDDGHRAFLRKYRHVAAVHSKARPSALSHDTQVSPSFVGFRNLMVIVLGVFIVLRNDVPHSTDVQQSSETYDWSSRTCRR